MIHKTWNGVDIPICSMDDEHLMSMIKLQFKPYSNEKENELLSFMVGKTLPKMTVEVFNNIMVNKSLYIIEAMRRDSTRNTLIEFLGTFNPVYKTTVMIENPNKLQLNSSKSIKQDVYDEFDETDKYWGCSGEELF